MKPNNKKPNGKARTMKIGKWEDISPKKAKEYLAKNIRNRHIRQNAVIEYAIDMQNGKWRETPEGIVFDMNDHLIDGQHRLEAIVLADVTVRMFVWRGFPPDTQDILGRGRVRTNGDQLALHGYQNANLTAACCNVIAQLCVPAKQKLSWASAQAVLRIYKAEIEAAIAGRSMVKKMNSSVVIGTVAFMMKAEFAKIQEFYKLLTTGEGIYRNGPTSPAYAINTMIMSTVLEGPAARERIICAILNAGKRFVEGEELVLIKHTRIGLEYFRMMQEESVAKVKDVLTLTVPKSASVNGVFEAKPRATTLEVATT